MKLTTLIPSLLLGLLTLIGCSNAQPVIERTRASIIRISRDETLFSPSYVCTGFVVAPQTVLTANHCVGPQLLADGYEAKTILRDSYYDLAVLSVDHTHKVPLILRDDPVVEGEQLVGIGYGLGFRFAAASHVLVIVPNGKFSPTESTGIIVQGGYIHGQSGGPVIDAQGYVVGIVQQSDEQVGYGVGVPMIRAFLVDAGVLDGIR